MSEASSVFRVLCRRCYAMTARPTSRHPSDTPLSWQLICNQLCKARHFGNFFRTDTWFPLQGGQNPEVVALTPCRDPRPLLSPPPWPLRTLRRPIGNFLPLGSNSRRMPGVFFFFFFLRSIFVAWETLNHRKRHHEKFPDMSIRLQPVPQLSDFLPNILYRQDAFRRPSVSERKL
ncbi:hypothetical protein BC826DRAFT_479775 [Russula brevipes]|nr:hypothetical protein BC826DRAFT_479775 [Russula brevipes]